MDFPHLHLVLQDLNFLSHRLQVCVLSFNRFPIRTKVELQVINILLKIIYLFFKLGISGFDSSKFRRKRVVSNCKTSVFAGEVSDACAKTCLLRLDSNLVECESGVSMGEEGVSIQ